VVYWCNSYTIVHCSLDIIEWFKYKLEKVFKLYLILIHPPLSINNSHVIAYVPINFVKDILTQPDLEGRRGKWITVMLEYDLEIKPTKLIKGQGIAKLMA
jgi:hypothetical protein